MTSINHHLVLSLCTYHVQTYYQLVLKINSEEERKEKKKKMVLAMYRSPLD